MGLLTNEENAHRLSNILLKHGNKICLISYTVGIIWFLTLAHPDQNGKTYFSENALLPGLVDSDLHHDFGANIYVEELKNLLDNRSSYEDLRYSIPIEWFKKKLEEVGLEVHTQNYSFKFPYAGPNRQLKGENIFGILRAPRAAGVESIVLSSPFRSGTLNSDSTYVGLGLMIALAKAFRTHSYWAKDIIFLMTTNEEIGVQAWLASYHHSPTKYIEYEELTARAGSIQAAINLELNSEQINKMDLRILGLNGQLPNLDLVNTAARLCQREYIPITFQNKRNINNRNTLNGYLWSLETMLIMMWRQASGVPSGNHGYFNKYSIEAITLHGVRTSASKRQSILQIARVVEGILRSINNLLERFHQSFFFYILPSTDRYISIGLYMPPFGLILLPVAIKLFSLWIMLRLNSKLNEERKEKLEMERDMIKQNKTKTMSNDDDNDDEENVINKNEDNEKVINKRTSMSSVFSCFSVLLICAFFSFGLMYAIKEMIKIGARIHVDAADTILLVFLAAHTCMFACPKILLRKSSNAFDAKLLKCIGLFLFALTVGCISLLNISFATFVAAAAVPVVVIVRPVSNRFLSILHRLLLILISPLSILFIISLGSNFFQLYKSKSSSSSLSIIDPSDLLKVTWTNVRSNLLSASLQYEMIGCWPFGWLCLIFMPLWLLHWIMTFGEWR